MTSRERVRAIIAGEETDRCAFWLGNPDAAAWPGIHEYFGTSEEEELRLLLGDDFRWMPAPGSNFPVDKEAHGEAGPFANTAPPNSGTPAISTAPVGSGPPSTTT